MLCLAFIPSLSLFCHFWLFVMGCCCGFIHWLYEFPTSMLTYRLGLVLLTQLHVSVAGRSCVHVRSACVVGLQHLGLVPSGRRWEQHPQCLGWRRRREQNLVLCLYIHSPVARTFYCAHPHTFMRVHIHVWLKCLNRFIACVSHLSVSPPPFSCLIHPCCSLTVTSRPLPTTTSLTIPSTRSCRTYPS